MSNEESGVVTSADVAQKVPKSFDDLSKAQLLAAAQAFATSEDGTKDDLKSDLLESGVTFRQYLEMFYPESAGNQPLVEEVVEVVSGGEEVEEVVTAAPDLVLPSSKYLIKMTRSNPYFEFGRYKFTQEKPYAIMPAEDAQRILESEEGFRQAYPAELQEFYG